MHQFSGFRECIAVADDANETMNIAQNGHIRILEEYDSKQNIRNGYWESQMMESRSSTKAIFEMHLTRRTRPSLIWDTLEASRLVSG